ncbi:MAG: pyruvate decarboxylase, partial [Chryseobacterium sp.]
MGRLLFFLAITSFLLIGTASIKAQKNTDDKIKKVLYFNPEVEPDIEEIKEPTNNAFFSTVSDNTSNMKRNKMLRAEVQIPYDSIDKQTIIDYCSNNATDFAIVPKVKYFKV